MLSTEIPKTIWRGEQTRNKILGRVENEKDKFYKKPDTNYQASLDQMYGPNEVKRLSFASAVNDHGENDMISDKKFTFKSVNDRLLEQLPDDRAFKFSSGIKGINDYFDDMAPNKDYRYTDPQFYQYRLNGMTQQKIVESRWKSQGDPQHPDDLDAYARAVAYTEEYMKNKPRYDAEALDN